MLKIATLPVYQFISRDKLRQRSHRENKRPELTVQSEQRGISKELNIN